MKKLLFVIILLGIYSCALTGDFKFYYDYDGMEIEGTGTSAAPFKLGDKLVIRIPRHPRRKCTAIVNDGNHHKHKSCKGKKGTFVKFDLGKITTRSTKVVAMSVARKGSDTISGKLYLGLANAQHEPVNIDYECPLWSIIDNQFTCMRPMNFDFTFTIHPPAVGSIQVLSSDCTGTKIKTKKRIVAEISEDPEKAKDEILVDHEWHFKIKNTQEGYCPIRIDFGNKDGLKSSTLHIDFYSV